MLLTSLLLPFQTNSTSRLSSKSRKRNLSGSGLSASRKRIISCCSCSVSRGMKILFFSVFYLVSDRGRDGKYNARASPAGGRGGGGGAAQNHPPPPPPPLPRF